MCTPVKHWKRVERVYIQMPNKWLICFWLAEASRNIKRAPTSGTAGLMRQPAGNYFHHQTAQCPYIHLQLSAQTEHIKLITSRQTKNHNCTMLFLHLFSDLSSRIEEFRSHIPHQKPRAIIFRSLTHENIINHYRSLKYAGCYQLKLETKRNLLFC